MPYQIKNGIVYGSNAVSLTQAQYDALSTAEKNNGTVYYIYDSDAVLDASDVALGTGTVEDLAGAVATIETSPATANHAVGEYILWNGVVYAVTSAIATGENLVINSNISARTIGSELTALNNGLTPLEFSSEVKSGFTLPSWGYITGVVIGKICIVSIVGLSSNANINSDTPAIEIPYTIRTPATTRNAVSASTFVTASAKKDEKIIYINNAQANENMYLVLMFCVY